MCFLESYRELNLVEDARAGYPHVNIKVPVKRPNLCCAAEEEHVLFGLNAVISGMLSPGLSRAAAYLGLIAERPVLLHVTILHQKPRVYVEAGFPVAWNRWPPIPVTAPAPAESGRQDIRSTSLTVIEAGGRAMWGNTA